MGEVAKREICEQRVERGKKGGPPLDNTARHDICQMFYNSTFSKFKKFTPKKCANYNMLNLKCDIFGISIHQIGII